MRLLEKQRRKIKSKNKKSSPYLRDDFFVTLSICMMKFSQLLIGGGVFFALTGMSIGFAYVHDSRQTHEADLSLSVEEQEQFRHPLTGEVLSREPLFPPRVFGVMVENSADAWPLSGVDEAFVVIEAPVEGNIPRFIAFYGEDQIVAKIGPVRSARPYYIDWNQEFYGVYAHVGGSAEALEKIRQTETVNLDQFFDSEYFYRDEQTRFAPHNVYTTTNDLKNSLDELQKKYPFFPNATYDAWLFQDGASHYERSMTIHIDWPSASVYNVDWSYDPLTNLYHRDQGGVRYTANNVVVFVTDIATIDAAGRKSLRTLGSGLVLVFQNGEAHPVLGLWRKDSPQDRLRFYDDAGKEVVMNAGKTWIEVVDDIARLSVQGENFVQEDYAHE